MRREVAREPADVSAANALRDRARNCGERGLSNRIGPKKVGADTGKAPPPTRETSMGNEYLACRDPIRWAAVM